jgi:hypothetical protein
VLEHSDNPAVWMLQQNSHTMHHIYSPTTTDVFSASNDLA